MAGTGPAPMMAGSTPTTAQSTSRASGVTPARRAAAALATTSAAAPSVTPLELPAVTLPWPSLRNAGLRLASFSAVICGRGNSSCSKRRVGGWPFAL